MNFFRLGLLLALALLLGAGGCRRTISPEEKVAREEVRAALHSRAFDRAIPLARRVLRFAPNDNGAWARLAQAQFGLGDLTGLRQTLADWRGAVKRTSAKYDEYRGDLAFAENRRAEALAAWMKAVAPKDRRLRVFLKIARLEQDDGHWQEAAAAWRRGMKGRETAEILLNRALCYRHLHSWDAARADVQRAAQLAPDDPLVRRALRLQDRLGKFLAEVRDLDRDLSLRPNDVSLLGDRALLFLHAGDAALALDDASKAAGIASDAVRPKLLRALAEQMLGRAPDPATSPGVLQLDALFPDFLQTIRRLDAELAAEPKSADLLTNRAWQLNEIGQPKLALADATAALDADSKSAGAAAEASYALAKLKRAPEAYARIKQATELDANFSTAWQYRGELEMQQNDFLAAIESLSRALAINQTTAALGKREECYRKLGLLAKAADDRKSLEELSALH
ncbi:MAG TPA: tetratricopeptide repeat protein [Chthoniobacterales bacterium]